MAKHINKESSDTLNFTNSFNTLKEAAKVINEQVSKTAGEVQADIYANGEQFVDQTSKAIKDTLAKVDLKANIEEGIESIKTTTQKVNAVALETADDLAEGIYKNGKEWQQLAEKAITGGIELATKQQDIVFSTLETMKGQMGEGIKRFSQMFKTNAN